MGHVLKSTNRGRRPKRRLFTLKEAVKLAIAKMLSGSVEDVFIVPDGERKERFTIHENRHIPGVGDRMWCPECRRMEKVVAVVPRRRIVRPRRRKVCLP